MVQVGIHIGICIGVVCGHMVWYHLNMKCLFYHLWNLEVVVRWGRREGLQWEHSPVVWIDCYENKIGDNIHIHSPAIINCSHSQPSWYVWGHFSAVFNHLSASLEVDEYKEESGDGLGDRWELTEGDLCHTPREGGDLYDIWHKMRPCPIAMNCDFCDCDVL